jgi:ribonucleoside-triphosphate reductase
LYVIKRDGTTVPFDKEKIRVAILKAFLEVDGRETSYAKNKARMVATQIEKLNRDLSVEEIQDLVVERLMASSRKDVAERYVEYRYKHRLAREGNTTDKDLLELISGTSDYWNAENSNKNADLVTTQRDYMAGIVSEDISKRFLLPPEIVDAHEKGIIHFHDIDYFGQKTLHNCDLINLEDVLQNGTVINNVKIEKPHRILTASTIATQVILGVASSSYGGATITLTHLAPFVRSSYEAYLKKYKDWGFDDESACKYAQLDTKKEVVDAVQTFNYQVNSMTTTNGQAPFLSVFMYLNETEEYKNELAMLIEEFIKQRILGFKNEKGVYITPAFPKLLYVLEPDNLRPGDKYFYLTELAAKCTAKRLVPDIISEKMMLELKKDKTGKGRCYPCMGCRSFLTPYIDENNNPKYYGRFNQGVVTISLPDLAFSSGGNIDKFWQLFEERTELCHKALQLRHKRLEGTLSDVAPILWQNGALARLEKGERLDKLLHNGYSTISLGYAGLYECVKYMTGHSHTQTDGKPFALEVMARLNEKCAEWKAVEKIDYSLYGAPIESTTYKFARCLKQRFGNDIFIKLDEHDRNYITNSYHVPVFEEINAFDKLAFEAEFQKLSPGGAISYVEVPNLQNNIPAVLELYRFIYDNIMYAELNTKSDYCQKCGFDGEILIDDNMEWYCPNCGNRDHSTLNVARRTCGYIGSNFWNFGRTQEIKERVLHLGES